MLDAPARNRSHESERRDLASFMQTLRGTTATPTRRDLLRWSALSAGALATARSGIGAGPVRAATPARQDAAIVAEAEIVVPFDAFGQAVTLDPHRSSDYGGFWVMYPNVWAGLLGFDENGRVVRDLAEQAVVGADGLSYQFTIREGATYASGNPVLAEHFLLSWARALDPANPSPMAPFFQYVAGYDDFVNQVDGASLGFSAPDDRTVVVELSSPQSFFPSYMASFAWAVVDPAVLEEAGDQNFVINGASAGPWQFDEFAVDTEFVMVPNPNFYGETSPSISRIVWPILTGPSAARQALDLYLNDEAVSADVPLSLQGEVEADETLASEMVRLDGAQGTVRSLAMDFGQPPFDDVRVRRAFALAFDRDRFAEIYAGTWTATDVFTPPVVRDLAGYEPPAGLPFDVEGARSLLAEAGFPGGEGLPAITYYHPVDDSEEEIGRIREMLVMLAENLEVEINFDTSRTQQQIDDLRGDNGGRQIDLVWWQNIYETPHLLSEVFRPDSPFMQGWYNWSPDLAAIGDFDPGADAQTFADLMSQADAETDADARNDLYAQGEELVLQNAVYVPVANWVPMFVQKPYLQGTRQGPWTGRLPVLFDQDVVVVEQ